MNDFFIPSTMNVFISLYYVPKNAVVACHLFGIYLHMHEEYFGIDCESGVCGYRNDEEYDEEYNVTCVVNYTKDGPVERTVCEQCGEGEFEHKCDICGMRLYDSWIGEYQVGTINKALGEGTLPATFVACRMCVDYTDMDDFKSVLEPAARVVADKDIVAYAHKYKSKWMDAFGYDNLMCEDTCLRASRMEKVDAKIRRFLAEDVVRSIKEVQESHRAEALRVANETERRTREVAKMIHQYIPCITEEESTELVKLHASRWVQTSPSNSVFSAASLFRAALMY